MPRRYLIDILVLCVALQNEAHLSCVHENKTKQKPTAPNGNVFSNTFILLQAANRSRDQKPWEYANFVDEHEFLCCLYFNWSMNTSFETAITIIWLSV